MPRNPDGRHPDFKLIPAGIHIEQGCWLAARAVVVCVPWGGALCCVWAVSPGDRDHPMTVYAGNPAQPVKQRVISNQKHHYASDA